MHSSSGESFHLDVATGRPGIKPGLNHGWLTGLEPAATGATILGSTN